MTEQERKAAIAAIKQQLNTVYGCGGLTINPVEAEAMLRYIQSDVAVTNKIFPEMSTKPFAKEMERAPLFSDLLPNKVIFDVNKGKTTLLFGEKPYRAVSSGVMEGDIFNKQDGFYITLAKAYSPIDWKEKLEFWNMLSSGDFNKVKAEMKSFVFNRLNNRGILSLKQLEKLLKWNFDKKLIFNALNQTHIIEVVDKFSWTEELGKRLEAIDEARKNNKFVNIPIMLD